MAKVTLRPIRESDLPLMLAWGNMPEIWEYLPSSRKGEKLTWENHLIWFVNRRNRVDYMIDIGRPVGVIHATDYLSSDSPVKIPEIGLYIGEPGLWGQGVGKQALAQMLDLLPQPVAYAVIHPRNKRSIRLFTSLRFKKVQKARKGQDLYLFEILRYRTVEVEWLRSMSSPSLTLEPSTSA